MGIRSFFLGGTRAAPARRDSRVLVDNGVVAPRSASQRTASVPGERSQLVGPGGVGNGFIAAASTDHRIPFISSPSPQSITAGNVTVRARTRYLYGSNAWARGAIDRLGDRVIGDGPTPDSGDPDLDALFMRSSNSFDARGVMGFPSLLREEMHRPFVVDGEALIQRRTPTPIGFDDNGFPLFNDGGIVPLKLLTMSAEWIADYQTSIASTFAGKASISVGGIVLDATDPVRRMAYWLYDHHPGDLSALFVQSPLAQQVSSDDVAHLFTPPMAGSLRGQSRLTPIVQRFFGMDDYEEAEAQRKRLQARITTIFTERADMAGEGLLSQAQMSSATGGEGGGGGGSFDMDEFRQQLDLSGGGAMKLPEGLDAKLLDPKATPSTDDWWHLNNKLAFAAALSLPGYEVSPDFVNLSDRVMKMATIILRMTVSRERSQMDTQVLAKIWRWFVLAAYASGRWKPKAGTRLADWLITAWDWPIVEDAQLAQDLKSYVQAEQVGFVDRDWVTKNVMGRDPGVVARKRAEIAARDRAYGFRSAPVEVAPAGSIVVPEWDADAPLAQQVLKDVTSGLGVPAKIPDAVPKPPKPPAPPAPGPAPVAPEPSKPAASG